MPLLLAGDELGEGGLDDLRVVQEAVEVVQEQQGGAVGVGQGRAAPAGRPAGRRRRLGRCRPTAVRQTQAVGDVPDGDLPVLLAGVLDDLAFGLVGLERLDPQAGEGGVDVVGQLVGQVHGSPFVEDEKGPGLREPMAPGAGESMTQLLLSTCCSAAAD